VDDNIVEIIRNIDSARYTTTIRAAAGTSWTNLAEFCAGT